MFAFLRRLWRRARGKRSPTITVEIRGDAGPLIGALERVRGHLEGIDRRRSSSDR